VNDGTIILCTPRKANLIQKAIQFFTGHPQTHAAIWFEDGVYEENIGGARYRRINIASAGRAFPDDVLEFWQPAEELTATERGWMRTFLWWTARHPKKRYRMPYNYLKLLILALVYPTRSLWQWVGWMPFQNDILGEVCSTYVDSAWHFTGRDIIWEYGEEFTVPGDLANRPGFYKSNSADEE